MHREYGLKKTLRLPTSTISFPVDRETLFRLLRETATEGSAGPEEVGNEQDWDPHRNLGYLDVFWNGIYTLVTVH